MPHLRYVCASHNVDTLGIRDSVKMRRLIKSEWYQGHWGDRVKLTSDQNAKKKFENAATGFREAIAAGSITGSRGDRVLIDDPHSVESAGSDQQRATTLEWFREAVPSRMNDPKRSVIIVIMQRLHEEDVSGLILENEGFRGVYDHIMLPMRFDPLRKCITKLGYEDPRTDDGELLFPARFPPEVQDRDEAAMGPYAVAGQMQQEPVPRGGGIIKDAWWQLWESNQYPLMDFVIASLDTAYTKNTSNDPSAMTIWGMWSGDRMAVATRNVDRYGKPYDDVPSSGNNVPSPKAMMMYAWKDHLELHELVERVIKVCTKMKVDILLIESKASGHSVAQEIMRLVGNEKFGVHLYNPKDSDKMGRLYSVQHLFAEKLVYAPDKEWAEMVIRQTASFPRGKHDDLVDTVSMALKWVRTNGMFTRAPEKVASIEDEMRNYKTNDGPLYPA